MKILFGHHGLRGDLAINLPAIERILKENPGAMIDMPIHKQFADMAPLFLNHPAINATFITDEYENFPNDKDKAALLGRKYNHILNPMARHKRDDWWNAMHQTSAVLYDYTAGGTDAILAPEDQQINLVKWFDVKERDFPAIAIAPWAGAYNPNNDKRLSEAKTMAICNYILQEKNMRVVMIGGPGDPVMSCCELNYRQSYFESVKAMLACKFLIHADTGMGWICSGYKHKQLGLYGHRYYGKDNVKNIQPVNPNGTYLDADKVNDIPDDEIFAAIDKLLE